MAVTFLLAPNPHWVVIDNFSKLPNGAVIYTYSSLNPSQFKAAYQTPNINTPFGQPISGSGNGTFPPIYWAFDDTQPDDLYFIRVFDKPNTPGNDAVELWNFSGLPAFTTGGGGGTITTNLDLENLITNGQFYRNAGNIPAVVGSLPLQVTLAPSNHDAFCGVANDPANEAAPAPDIIFAKNNTNSTDSISFTDFPSGSSLFGTQPTPQLYVNYTCSVPGAGETYKLIQFPIAKGLRNLENTNISVSMWNRYGGGNSGIILRLRQFFGNGGGPSPDVITNLGTLQFSGANWNKTEFISQLIPSTATKTFGSCGNDALFLQIFIPAGALVNFDFILPAVYVGDATSVVDFHTLDFVDSIVNTPRTGDVRISINSFHDYGWVPANDGFIGSATSGANTRSNIDTFPLYDLIWNAVPDSFARVTGGRGVSSIADFDANKPMQLTRSLGRVMAGALPSSAALSFTNTGNVLTVSSTAEFYNGMSVVITGGALPVGLASGKIYYVTLLGSTTLQLATNTANAIAGTPIVLGSNASGTITPANVETLGSFIGEEQHLQAEAEMFAHTHTYTVTNAGGAFLQGGPGGQNQIDNTGSRGGTTPFNIIQPTVYMNCFIKL